jgi:P-type Ca2+ transporter type 2B
MAFRMGYDYKRVRNREHIQKIFPFSSAKKKMDTVYKEEKGPVYCFVKGGPDFLLPCCTKFINKTGHVTKITPEFSSSMQENILDFASQSLRTILLAYKEVPDVPQEWEEVESELIIIGMVGIKDPLRDGIQEAVQICKEAGVQVRMVTGDNKDTAVAIAKEAGILDKEWQPREGDCTVMEGKDFREFVGGLINEGEEDEGVGDIENFKKVAEELCVLARSSPDDKYLIATGLKQLLNVVAMTGDGTNDAPALKKADIGFAMGIAGT